MKTLKPLLLIALVFIAGFAGGVVATRLMVRQYVREALRDPMVLQARIERDLNRRLELSAEQQAQLHQILADTGEKIKGLRQDTRRQIAAILTTAQKEKFERPAGRARLRREAAP